MKKLPVLALASLLALCACSTLTPADEARIAELATQATQRVLTAAETEELRQLQLKGQGGEFDPSRLLEMAAAVVMSLLGVQVVRGPRRTPDQTAALREIASERKAT